MSTSEFTFSQGVVTSVNGFTIRRDIGGRVIYRDGGQEIRINSEFLASPHGIILYGKKSQRLSDLQQRGILSNVVRALEYMGYPVELQESEYDGP